MDGCRSQSKACRAVPIDFEPEVPSAQVQECRPARRPASEGVTRVRESTATRDHTERALAAFGVEALQDAQGISIRGGQRLTAQSLRFPVIFPRLRSGWWRPRRFRVRKSL